MKRVKTAFVRFCNLMAKGDLTTATGFTQKTWRATATAPDATMTVLAAKLDWTKVTYRTLAEISKACYDVRFESEGKEFYLRLICERAPYKPTQFGTWGVNPLSLRRLHKNEMQREKICKTVVNLP